MSYETHIEHVDTSLRVAKSNIMKALSRLEDVAENGDMVVQAMTTGIRNSFREEVEKINAMQERIEQLHDIVLENIEFDNEHMN